MALADIRSLLRQSDIELYKSCYVSTNRFTTIMYRMTRQSNDSCVLFKLAGKLAIGFIVNIIRARDNALLFRINRVSIKDKLHVIIDGKPVTCPNVFYGDLDPSNTPVLIRPPLIIEKIVHLYSEQLSCYVFFRIPNLCESS